MILQTLTAYNLIVRAFVDLTSLWNTNRKSYFATHTQFTAGHAAAMSEGAPNCLLHLLTSFSTGYLRNIGASTVEPVTV